MTIRYLLCEVVLVALTVVGVCYVSTQYASSTIISDDVAAHSAIAREVSEV